MVYPIFFTPYPRILIPQTHENLQSKPKSTNNHQIFLSTPCFIPKFFTTFASAFRDVAQPGRVHVWGACCRRFKSCHPDSENQRLTENSVSLFLLVEHKWNTFHITPISTSLKSLPRSSTLFNAQSVVNPFIPSKTRINSSIVNSSGMECCNIQYQ